MKNQREMQWEEYIYANYPAVIDIYCMPNSRLTQSLVD